MYKGFFIVDPCPVISSSAFFLICVHICSYLFVVCVHIYSLYICSLNVFIFIHCMCSCVHICSLYVVFLFILLFELHFVSFPCLHWHLFPLVEQMQMRYVASGQLNDAEGKRQIRKGFFGLE